MDIANTPHDFTSAQVRGPAHPKWVLWGYTDNPLCKQWLCCSDDNSGGMDTGSMVTVGCSAKCYKQQRNNHSTRRMQYCNYNVPELANLVTNMETTLYSIDCQDKDSQCCKIMQ